MTSALDWLEVATRQDEVDGFLRRECPEISHGERWRLGRRLAIGDARITAGLQFQLTAATAGFNEAVAQLRDALAPIGAIMAATSAALYERMQELREQYTPEEWRRLYEGSFNGEADTLDA